MRIAGVATVKERSDFFLGNTLPSLDNNTDHVQVYCDYPNSILIGCWDWAEFPNLGDAGKFAALTTILSREPEEGFYFFSADDDLVYSPEYFDHMVSWLKRFDNKVVVSLHGSGFTKFPIDSYYIDKRGRHCLYPNYSLHRTLFPGTGAMAFHSSLFTKEERRNFLDNFPIPNMADIWMGLLLQKKKIPAAVVPHDGNLLTYNENLPLEDTIWGRQHNDDFVQTALINQFSLNPGFEYFPLPKHQDQ